MTIGHDQDLERLAELIRNRNAVEEEISRLLGRSALTGHVGEYIAGKIFGITLSKSAAEKGIDGAFSSGPLAGASVNIKWSTKDEGLLDLSMAVAPACYLVLAGPRAGTKSSRGETGPWLIRSVYLFDGPKLHRALQARGVKMGTATSVVRAWWEDAQIFPEQRNTILPLSDEASAGCAFRSPPSWAWWPMG
jgi:hypothetical protein